MNIKIERVAVVVLDWDESEEARKRLGISDYSFRVAVTAKELFRLSFIKQDELSIIFNDEVVLYLKPPIVKEY